MTKEEEHEKMFEEYYHIEELIVNEGDDFLWDEHFGAYRLLESLNLIYEYETWRIEKFQKEKTGGNKDESKEMV